MAVEKRFLKYVSYWTTSQDDQENIPSTKRQFELAKVLEQELKELNLEKVRLDEHCYVYGLLPATAGMEGKKAVGFIAHMDTAPDFSGENVKPQIIENYNGEDVLLPGSGTYIKVEDFPHLASLKGRTLITTDGTSLLGADDKAGIAEILTAEAVEKAGYDSLDAAKEDGVAFVFMGHGTSHTAKISYSQMQAQMQELGYENVFIGTVEGEPEDTACEAVIEAVKNAGYKKVVLRPLMVVAGDHANNDMAGDDDDSWKSQFVASGNFDSVDCQIAGLGEIPAIQDIYVAHTAAATAIK